MEKGKVVILVGSERRNGNTARLAAACAEGARGANEVTVFSAADWDVRPCSGCNACRRRPDGTCCRPDGMAAVFTALAAADVIVLASPVYFYGLSAQLAAVLNRLHQPARRTFRVKSLALLLVAADPGQAVFGAILAQYRLILSYFHLKDAGQVLAPGVEAAGAIDGNPALDAARRLGASLAAAD